MAPNAVSKKKKENRMKNDTKHLCRRKRPLEVKLPGVTAAKVEFP